MLDETIDMSIANTRQDEQKLLEVKNSCRHEVADVKLCQDTRHVHSR